MRFEEGNKFVVDVWGGDDVFDVDVVLFCCLEGVL